MTNPLDKGQPRLSGDLNSQTFHEEEESSGEDKALGFLHHTQFRVEDSDSDVSQDLRVARGSGRKSGPGRKKLPHLAAEEEEESVDNSDSPEIISVAQHRVAQGSKVGLQSGAETDSNVPEGWGHTGTPAPTPSQTPTVFKTSQ